MTLGRLTATTPEGQARCDAVLAFIREYMSREGWAPTIREIGAGVGLRSTSTTLGYVLALVAQGRLERNPGSPRAMRVLR